MTSALNDRKGTDGPSWGPPVNEGSVVAALGQTPLIRRCANAQAFDCRTVLLFVPLNV